MTYTQIAVSMILATVVLDLWVLRTRLLTRKAFWTAYAIVVFFQLLTNGVLTGFNIVRYNGDVIIGSATPVLIGDGRLFYAPIEDLMFGFSLVVQTMAWWVFWGRRGVQVEPKAGPVRLWFGMKPKG
ncbi:MAG: lycopene cyclase domain-containing protein [Actinobacteria bacterium]|nr:lycopene cyclase domain-containing protein [Actinomycetota bacterium]